MKHYKLLKPLEQFMSESSTSTLFQPSSSQGNEMKKELYYKTQKSHKSNFSVKVQCNLAIW